MDDTTEFIIDEQQSAPAEEMAGLCQKAVEQIEFALKQPPVKLDADADRSEQTLVHLRNALIGKHRQSRDLVEAQTANKHLRQVNIAISLVAGVEFPATGIHRKGLKEAKGVLEKIQF